MSKSKKTLYLLLMLGFFAFSVKSQYPNDDWQKRQDQEIKRQRAEKDLNDRIRNLDKLQQRGLREHQAALNRKHSPPNKPLTREEKAKIEKILAPDAADLAEYKTFLQQPNTGIFRLFPDLNCEAENYVIRADGECGEIVSGSWIYSFRQKNYARGNFFDIKLKDENLISRGFLSQGIFINLGDLALENVSPSNIAVKFLLDFKPETEIAKVKRQFAQLSEGVQEANGFRYANSLKADLNTTYALRVIAYRSSKNIVFNRLSRRLTEDEIGFLTLNDDKRIDLTVAFRIIRCDKSGSLTIIWKELNRQDAPKLIFGKKEKPSDIK